MGALHLFEQMLQEELDPDSKTYAFVMCACVQARHWQRTVSLFDDMQKLGLDFSAPTYHAMVLACEKLGDKQHAVALFEEAQRRHEEHYFDEALRTERVACYVASRWARRSGLGAHTRVVWPSHVIPYLTVFEFRQMRVG